MIRMLHKWIGIVLGVVLLMWIATGIVFFIPEPTVLEHETISSPISKDELRLLNLSPYNAFEKINDAFAENKQIQSLSLLRIDNVILYKFVVEGGREYMINANTGLLFKITSDVAKSIAINSFGREASVNSVELLKQRSFFYSWGQIPAYKVEFNDDLETNIYISPNDGEILRAHNYWSRIIAVNHDLHSFGVIRNIIDRGIVQATLVTFVAMVIVFCVLSGYYMALPKRKRL